MNKHLKSIAVGMMLIAALLLLSGMSWTAGEPGSGRGGEHRDSGGV